MRTSSTVTLELMERIWLLYKKGIKTDDIASVLSTSRQTVYRVVTVMKTAESGDVYALNALYGKDYAKQKQYAMKYFGLSADADEKKKDDEVDNTAYCMANVVKLLASIDEKLGMLCNELGVKGVE